jgi:hypothetical protein
MDAYGISHDIIKPWTPPCMKVGGAWQRRESAVARGLARPAGSDILFPLTIIMTNRSAMVAIDDTADDSEHLKYLSRGVSAVMGTEHRA